MVVSSYSHRKITLRMPLFYFLCDSMVTLPNLHLRQVKYFPGELMNASLENFKRLSDGKDDNSWAQPPEPLTQVVGDTFSVVVTHLQSPSDFTVQKVENASKILGGFFFSFFTFYILSINIYVFGLLGVIQELQLKLKEHCCQVTTPQSFRPAPGTVCCAQFSSTVKTHQSKIIPITTQLQLKVLLGMFSY